MHSRNMKGEVSSISESNAGIKLDILKSILAITMENERARQGSQSTIPRTPMAVVLSGRKLLWKINEQGKAES